MAATFSLYSLTSLDDAKNSLLDSKRGDLSRTFDPKCSAMRWFLSASASSIMDGTQERFQTRSRLGSGCHLAKEGHASAGEIVVAPKRAAPPDARQNGAGVSSVITHPRYAAGIASVLARANHPSALIAWRAPFSIEGWCPSLQKNAVRTGLALHNGKLVSGCNTSGLSTFGWQPGL